MKVLLVDDNRLMLEGLQNLLEIHGFQLAGTAQDGLAAVAQARALKPDLILMDIRMPVCNGLDATRMIKAEMPEVKIVILTTSTGDQDLFEAVRSGACGYLLKNMDSQQLIEALEQAQGGIPPFSPGLASKILCEFRRLSGPERMDSSAVPTPVPGAEPTDLLSERQNEVLSLIAQGLSYKEAGVRLNLSPNTVKYHMAEIIGRLHLENRAQVLAYAGQIKLRGDKPSE